MENFIYQSSKTLHFNVFAELTSITGHFENCFAQSYYVVSFHCGKDNADFYFNRYQLAFDFYIKYANRYHSYDFMLNRMKAHHGYNYVLKLLYDDSINKVRFENPNKQKVIEFYASSTSDVVSFQILSNGNFSYTIKPVATFRE